ncbi:hypothetical protein [Spirosoma endbachense]|uniref:Uncharacterized protein n=1 Tax=Spirosoma endbachense TaxID=2666025 RepID=A0A6P1W3S6_9BACT|nr:hypothetical protein [Spirosoma endbachense]QHV99208.1 hypothetical protein GJR95_31215 [Spirosoma endbachense]
MKAGIVADDYKVPLFRAELEKAGFTFEVTHYSKLQQLSLIKVETTERRLKEIELITKRVEINAKRSN